MSSPHNISTAILTPIRFRISRRAGSLFPYAHSGTHPGTGGYRGPRRNLSSGCNLGPGCNPGFCRNSGSRGYRGACRCL